jgi:hypothetical protein
MALTAADVIAQSLGARVKGEPQGLASPRNQLVFQVLGQR